MTLTPLDSVCLAMDHETRPLDFTIVMRTSHPPDVAALRTGARSASEAYRATRSTTDGRRWFADERTLPHVKEIAVRSQTALEHAVEAFVDAPFDVRREPPVRQLLIPGRALATRFHHAVADGVSGFMWLSHQLRIASGDSTPRRELGQHQLILRTGVRRGGRQRPSTPLWHRQGRATRARRWHVIQLARREISNELPSRSTFTYNDLLLAIALDVLGSWNRDHGLRESVGIWLPVDLRTQKLLGFGNGTSRVRVRSPHPPASSLWGRCRDVHEQVSRALHSGEWVVPSHHPLFRLPIPLKAAVTRAFCRRPWANYGTACFSHIERFHAEPHDLFDGVEHIELVGPLAQRHPLAITGVTHEDRTWLTFTYDPELLTRTDVEALATSYRNRFARAAQELSCAA
jgi:hypothetical protein